MTYVYVVLFPFRTGRIFVNPSHSRNIHVAQRRSHMARFSTPIRSSDSLLIGYRYRSIAEIDYQKYLGTLHSLRPAHPSSLRILVTKWGSLATAVGVVGIGIGVVQSN